MLASKLISGKDIFLGRPKHGLAVFSGQAQNGGAVDTEHQGLQVRVDVDDIRGGLDDACLQAVDVRDFEQWIDIVYVDLPKSKDLDWFGVQS